MRMTFFDTITYIRQNEPSASLKAAKDAADMYKIAGVRDEHGNSVCDANSALAYYRAHLKPNDVVTPVPTTPGLTDSIIALTRAVQALHDATVKLIDKIDDIR